MVYQTSSNRIEVVTVSNRPHLVEAAVGVGVGGGKAPHGKPASQPPDTPSCPSSGLHPVAVQPLHTFSYIFSVPGAVMNWPSAGGGPA